MLFVVLHRWGLMVLSLHRSRCTSFTKSNCSATRTSPTLTQGPQVLNVHARHFKHGPQIQSLPGLSCVRKIPPGCLGRTPRLSKPSHRRHQLSVSLPGLPHPLWLAPYMTDQRRRSTHYNITLVRCEEGREEGKEHVKENWFGWTGSQVSFLSCGLCAACVYLFLIVTEGYYCARSVQTVAWWNWFMREGERKEPWTVGDSATYVACWISSGRRRYVRECVTEQSRREFEFDLSLILGFFCMDSKSTLKFIWKTCWVILISGTFTNFASSKCSLHFVLFWGKKGLYTVFLLMSSSCLCLNPGWFLD